MAHPSVLHVTAAQRLALGTAQFGSPYGIANQIGRVDTPVIAALLARARRAGMDTLDTAADYGSEERLGKIGMSDWKVVTKLPAVPAQHSDIAGWLQQQAVQSLERLQVNQIDAILLHRPLQLCEEKGELLYAALTDLKERGLTRRIGVSIYAPSQLETIWPRFAFDVVQAPLNVLDQRLIETGLLERLARAGVGVHVRSVFLQGLLLMEPVARASRFGAWSAVWQRWDAWLAEAALTPLEAALRFVMRQPSIERVVVGCEQPLQLEEILAAADGPLPELPAALAQTDERLIDPSQWAA